MICPYHPLVLLVYAVAKNKLVHIRITIYSFSFDLDSIHSYEIERLDFNFSTKNTLTQLPQKKTFIHTKNISKTFIFPFAHVIIIMWTFFLRMPGEWRRKIISNHVQRTNEIIKLTMWMCVCVVLYVELKRQIPTATTTAAAKKRFWIGRRREKGNRGQSGLASLRGLYNVYYCNNNNNNK